LKHREYIVFIVANKLKGCMVENEQIIKDAQTAFMVAGRHCNAGVDLSATAPALGVVPGEIRACMREREM
jgi:hypothetical protein